MSEPLEHFPWHYTEFGVICACGASMRDGVCPDDWNFACPATCKELIPHWHSTDGDGLLWTHRFEHGGDA